MTLLAVVAQAATEYGAVASSWLAGAIADVQYVANRAFRYAVDHLLVVAAVVAVLGLLILRPRHTPR
jgi:hypothetical protein